MTAFHDPSPRTIPRDELLLALLLTTTAHMGLLVPRQQVLVHLSRVVGGIQAQMLWLLCGGLLSD